MLLLLDNFDSFTYNLADYLGQLHADCKVLRNDCSMSEIHRLYDDGRLKGIVISPGPGTPSQSGNLMQVIDEFHRKLPILGICLGHQALGEYFGAELVKAPRPMHGKLSEIICEPDGLFDGLPQRFNVVRYNSLLINNTSPEIETIARTASGEVMALRHKVLPLKGVQFHPEAILTEHGLKMLENWSRTVQ